MKTPDTPGFTPDKSSGETPSDRIYAKPRRAWPSPDSPLISSVDVWFQCFNFASMIAIKDAPG